MNYRDLTGLSRLANLNKAEKKNLLEIGVTACVAYFGLKAACNHLSNVSKRKQSEKLIHTKAEEQIRVAQAEGDAEALKYERMRKADAELHVKNLQASLEAAKSRAEKKSEAEDFSSTSTPVQHFADICSSGDCSSENGDLVPGLLTKTDVGIIYAKGGLGKSTAVAQLMKELCLGIASKLMPVQEGLVPKHQHILFYAGEQNKADFQKTFGKTNLIELADIDVVMNFFFQNPEGWVNDVRAKLVSVQKDTVVILDNLSCITSGVSGEVIRKLFLQDLKQVQTEMVRKGVAITFLIVAHPNKGNDLSGSEKLFSFATMVVKFLACKDSEHLIMRIEKTRKTNNDMRGMTFLLERSLSEEGQKEFTNLGECTAEGTLLSEISTEPMSQSKIEEMHIILRGKNNEIFASKEDVDWIKAKFAIGFSTRDISKACGISHTAVDGFLNGTRKPVE